MHFCGKSMLLILEVYSYLMLVDCLSFIVYGSFSGLNLTPEANAAGAAFTPKLNAFANNLTRWELTVEDVQFGGGYPGYAGCNDLIPHAKWHAQTSAALSDMTRLMDFVLKLEKKHK